MLAEHASRVVAIRVTGDKFRSPPERVHDPIVIEQSEVPFACVHVSFEHKKNIATDIADLTDMRIYSYPSHPWYVWPVCLTRRRLSPFLRSFRKTRCTAELSCWSNIAERLARVRALRMSDGAFHRGE